MRDYHVSLEASCFYHIYNRAVGSANLFKEAKNYHFFLKKWNKYLVPHVNIWAYALIPNHFHFLIEIKELNSFSDEIVINQFLEEKFKRLFSSYSLAFNNMYDRNGALFQKRFKRVKVDSNSYLKHLIHYIHHNPIHHNLATDYLSWKYTSYSAVLSKKPTKICRNKVLEFFENDDSFISYHEEAKNYNKINHLIFE